MGRLILIMLVHVVLLCFCIYNSWFQREKSKSMFEHEKKKISPFNSYKAWILYSIIVAISIFLIIGYQIYALMDTIKNYVA